MSKRIILVLLVSVLALAMVGLVAFANKGGKTVEVNHRLAGPFSSLSPMLFPGEKAVEVNQSIAGSIFNGIEVTTDPVNQVTENRTLLNLYAKGAPGDANIEVVGGVIPVEPSDLCPDGTDLQFTFEDGGFVETFSDHSLLFSVIDPDPNADNALCVDFQGPATGIFDYVIIGGAGRFEGATGKATVTVTSWGVTSELSAEVGTIKGTVELP